MTTPNGVKTTYAYTQQNRLKQMDSALVSTPSTLFLTFTYALGAAGHRTGLTEDWTGTANDRNYAWEYDQLYRLQKETLGGNGFPASLTGYLGYTHDKVGNRLNRTTTLPSPPASVATQNLTFDLLDRTDNDTTASTPSTLYDANGNTLTASDQYSAENLLTNRNNGTVIITYDGLGQRVSKKVGGTTTYYLVSEVNPTGYAQVLEERTFNNPNYPVSRRYLYGQDLISQTIISSSATSYYGYDGLGSVRYLTDPSGAVTDTYVYDAYGNLLSSTGTTPNNYRYAGEQWDADLGLYYLRARYLDPSLGRFWTMDTFEGNNTDPLSLHKYLYTHDNPINRVDPSGHDPSFSAIGQMTVTFVQGAIRTGGALANAIAYSRVSFTLARAYSAAETALFYVEAAGITVGALGVVASGMDSMAERLLKNSQSVGDGPYPEMFKRGGQVERISGANLGGNVSIIDDLDGNGVGTSLRSHSLSGGIDSYLTAIRDDANEVSKATTSRIYGTTTDGKTTIDYPPGTIKQGALLIAVPENESRMLLDPRFRAALERYRTTYGVIIRVVPVPKWIRK